MTYVLSYRKRAIENWHNQTYIVLYLYTLQSSAILLLSIGCIKHTYNKKIIFYL